MAGSQVKKRAKFSGSGAVDAVSQVVDSGSSPADTSPLSFDGEAVAEKSKNTSSFFGGIFGQAFEARMAEAEAATARYKAEMERHRVEWEAERAKRREALAAKKAAKAAREADPNRRRWHSHKYVRRLDRALARARELLDIYSGFSPEESANYRRLLSGFEPLRLVSEKDWRTASLGYTNRLYNLEKFIAKVEALAFPDGGYTPYHGTFAHL